MIAQQLHIYPGENVIGGTVSYQLDTDSGVLTSEGNVTVGKWIFKKDIPLNSSNKVDPKMFLSSSLTLGKEINMGIFTLTVSAVGNGQAVCDFHVNSNGVSADGHAVLSRAGEYLSIVSINANGHALGQNFEIKVA